ncbi:programmed cell death 1 ligand 2 [Bombina bombina]|uniref:programmed cell death 1 ligand 2 n=1 Tax=Bombina bombina TaxID=8345 RepID=UPI00235B1487|nr:programmed cell death 1 ligand 2 [Bombina bombina]
MKDFLFLMHFRRHQAPAPLFLLHIIFALLSTTFALFTVQAPRLSYQALYGATVQMECNFQVDDNFNITKLTVSWDHIVKSKKREAYRITNGIKDLISQDNNYFGRTSMLMDELKKGRAILEIKDLKITDTGSYVCLLQLDGSDYKIIHLEVQASYENIHTSMQKSSDGNEVSLTCQAFGFPKAEVYWQNNGINASVSENTSHILTEESFYNTTSSITFKLHSKQEYDCVFWNQALHERTVASFRIPDSKKETHRKYIIPISCVIAVLFILLLVMCIKTYFSKRSRKKGQNNEPL